MCARFWIMIATGDFTWKKRDEDINGWNRKYAGKEAGCLSNSGYRLISINNRLMKGHRLAWLIVYGHWPDGVIDHIDGNPSNNKIDNLRCVEQSLNMRNQKRNRANKSGFKGVSFFSRDQRWMACIKVDKRTRYLGYFDTPEEAHEAYQRASQKYHGEFGRFA